MAKRSGKEEWKRKRRQEYLEQKEDLFYIFCEGIQTEPLYFSGFKQLIESSPIYRNMILIEIEPCGAETLRVLGQAEDYVENNDISRGQIWCVYDKDSFPAENFDGVVERIDKLNRASQEVQYHAAWSNECIEFWFVLHFANYTSNNARPEYIKFLNKKFKDIGLEKYEKNDPNTFNILLERGSPKLAIRYAKRLIEESGGVPPSQIAPGTKVFELVEELAQYLPEETKNKFFDLD